MSIADKIKAMIKDFGIEYFGRWYGWYPGEVVSVDDPQDQGRIKIRVPMLQLDPRNDTIPNFAYPMFGPFTPGPDKGSYNVPRVGDFVWVTFRNGVTSNPMYSPWGWHSQGQRPTEFESTEDRGWKTHAGHVVRFRDLDGDESILFQHTSGAKIEMDVENKIIIETNAGDIIRMDPSGTILIQHRGGTRAELDATSASIQASQSANIQAATITLQGTNVEIAAPGAIHPIVKGDVLMTWLSALYAWAISHVHLTGPFPAPPTLPPLPIPPLPPPPASMNSSKAKTG